jgi:acetyl-CoA carboxylase biotin carboxyl carrier protein
MPGKSKESSPQPPRVWNLDDIQQLLDLLASKEITEFEMEQQGVKIRVRRGNAHVVEPGNLNGFIIPSAPVPAVVASAPVAAAVAVEPAHHTHTPTAAHPAPAGESTEGLFIMKSPIVGTFYSSPAPNAPAFVKVGDAVEMGQVICIIEAMKLMNELEAEESGKIVRVYVENGQPVEYGQSLFAIEPAKRSR